MVDKNDENDDWPIIFSYTRKQAIEDGVLIDVTAEAKSAGFKVPVAIGDNLFNQYITPPSGLEGEGQSINGRLHDLFMMAHTAIRCQRGESRVIFSVLFLMKPGRTEKITVLAVIGPGDEGEPVLTICLPEDE